MIYHDAEAAGDSEDCPAERKKEICINCGYDWKCHNGWHCNLMTTTSFYKILSSERYLTSTMLASMSAYIRNIAAFPSGPPASCSSSSNHWKIASDFITNKAAKFKQNVESSHEEKPLTWQDFAHKAPGDCPCGIARSMCDYHRIS